MHCRASTDLQRCNPDESVTPGGRRDTAGNHPSCVGVRLPPMHAYFDVWLTRLLVQRGMAAIYVVAFIAVVHQFKPLLGEMGLLPVPAHLKNVSLRSAPTLFHWRYSDRLLTAVAWTGLLISVCALFGITEAGPIWLSLVTWLLLWVFYLSIVNVGQKFFAFGWESM